MIRGQFFGKMIWVSVRKSELQRKSQSYSPKVRVIARKSELNCLKRVSESDFGSSAEKGLKAFLNPPKVVTGVHRTGSPNKSIDQIAKNCPKNVLKLCFKPLWTIFGHFLDIFRTFFRHFSDILSTFPFSGLSNDLPVTNLI